MSHHLTLHSTGRHGCWAICSCGWKSAPFGGIPGAHLAFAEHLTDPTESAEEATDHG